VRDVYLFHAMRLRNSRQIVVTLVKSAILSLVKVRYYQYRAEAFAVEIRSFFPSRIRRRYAKLCCYSSRARFPEYTRKIGFTKACVKAAYVCHGICGAPLNFRQAADVFFDQFDVGFPSRQFKRKYY